MKRMKYLLMIILLLASIATISQTKSTNVEYFDQDWAATKNKSNAIYYRTPHLAQASACALTDESRK